MIACHLNGPLELIHDATVPEYETHDERVRRAHLETVAEAVVHALGSGKLA